MAQSKAKDVLPEEFSNLEEAGDFWDSHSLGDYWEETREVEIEVMVPRRHRVNIEAGLWEKVSDRAQASGVSIETLVNLWLAEKLAS